MLSAISVLEACGEELVEITDTFTVELLRGKNAFGYEPAELEGKSVLSILHPADHRAFVQTASALLAMAVGVAGVDAPLQSVRVLHRVFFRRHGQTNSEVMVDSIITAKRPDRVGAKAGLIMSSRPALPAHHTLPDDSGGTFRVFPAGTPQGVHGQ